VENRLRERPKFEKFFVEDRLNGFFVKNLENVQGDERDVMIFSVGYGYDEHGRITMNFGPLNKQGGERRLNVAITRARERVILVSSIKYDDIRLDSTQAQGVHSLHHYLRYAERRPKNLTNGVKGEMYSSPLELGVAEEIEQMGYKTVPLVGSSSFKVDLGVIDPEEPDRFILGVMCDGDNYRSANTSRDRDRLRIQVLESLGWNIHRIWSPDWLQRRETELRKLRKALQRAEKIPKKAVVKEEIVKPQNNEIKKAKVVEATGDKLPDVEPYQFANLRPKYLFSRYSPEHRERYLKEYHSEVARLLPQLVRIEGPIHIDLAFKRVNNAFRLKRATKSFYEVFMEEVKRAEKKFVVLRGSFLWYQNKKVKIRSPVEGVKESFRNIEHIPQQEIIQAMLLIAEHSFGLKEEPFINETARLLGFKRMGKNIMDTIKAIFEDAKTNGIIHIEDGMVVLSNKT
jgi:hypothetical protein